ncbi:NUDIX hydrolase [Pelagibius marinus]|uniref:NUDIX hydrolase n=1 Tax=Pelagibius marinus TaxID=2762760 RepID=UPI001D048DA3|nr:NUDIX domain-containing protein [Pelagibius marinus]
MSELDRYPKPAVTVDLVLMSVQDARLTVLLQRRATEPFAGRWALPGGFVRVEESLDAAAERVLAEKARMQGAWIEQLYSFGAPHRDPRDRVITVAYFALLPRARFEAALTDAGDLTLATLEVSWEGETGGPVAALGPDGAALPLAFDHGDILSLAVKRLRGKLDYTEIGFALLPDRFTLRELQDVHEAILGRPLNKPAFRRRMLERGWLESTGERETGTGFRPAELYRLKPRKG